MRRLLVCLLALAVVSGCSGSGGARLMDPFSRTTIEPPRTGWGNGQSDPYYSGTRQATLSSQGAQGPAWKGSGTADPGMAPLYQPRDSGRLGAAAMQTQAPSPAGPGDRIAIPVAARSSTDASSSWAHPDGAQAQPSRMANDAGESSGSLAATSSAVAAGVPRGSPITLPPPPTERRTPGESAGGDRVVGTIQPGSPGSSRSPYGRFSPPTVTHTDPQPRRLDASPQPVDIMDLPPARSPSSSQRSVNSSGIRLVSGLEEVNESAPAATQINGRRPAEEGVRNADTSSPQARYAHDPEYRWLRGRLEYSETTGRWKLRYISVEGTTDEFGGSVVLANPSQLSGYERGQFVEVHGRLGPAPQDADQGYAPEFEIAQIRGVGN